MFAAFLFAAASTTKRAASELSSLETLLYNHWETQVYVHCFDGASQILYSV